MRGCVHSLSRDFNEARCHWKPPLSTVFWGEGKESEGGGSPLPRLPCPALEDCPGSHITERQNQWSAVAGTLQVSAHFLTSLREDSTRAETAAEDFWKGSIGKPY